jgi:hypothetical protein
VVFTSAIALRLVPRGRTPTGDLGSHTPRTGSRIRAYAACIPSAGSLCISDGLYLPRTIPPTLAGRRMLVINGTLGTLGTNPIDTINLGRIAVLGVFLFPTAGTQLRDSLNMIVQGLELLQYNTLRNNYAKFLHQKPRTTFLRERKIMETQPSDPRGKTVRDLGSENVSSLSEYHQNLSLLLGYPTERARRQQPCQGSTGFTIP